MKKAKQMMVGELKAKLESERKKAKNKDNKKLDKMLERIKLCEAFACKGVHITSSTDPKVNIAARG